MIKTNVIELEINASKLENLAANLNASEPHTLPANVNASEPETVATNVNTSEHETLLVNVNASELETVASILQELLSMNYDFDLFKDNMTTSLNEQLSNNETASLNEQPSNNVTTSLNEQPSFNVTTSFNEQLVLMCLIGFVVVGGGVKMHPLSTCKNAYNYKIGCLNDKTIWKKCQIPTILTLPKHHTQVGRPKKNRRKTREEKARMVRDGKLSKAYKTISCTKCGNLSHNSRSCKGQQMNESGIGTSNTRKRSFTVATGGNGPTKKKKTTTSSSAYGTGTSQKTNVATRSGPIKNKKAAGNGGP
ncbi:hypothetical protein Tco_0432563 [Tanacetum coccineum]